MFFVSRARTLATILCLLSIAPIFGLDRESQKDLFQLPCVDTPNLDSAFRPDKRLATIRASVFGTFRKPKEGNISVRLDYFRPIVGQIGIFNSNWDGFYLLGGASLPWRNLFGMRIDRLPHISIEGGYRMERYAPTETTPVDLSTVPNALHLLLGRLGIETVEWFFPNLGLEFYTHFELQLMVNDYSSRTKLAPYIDAGVGISF